MKFIVALMSLILASSAFASDPQVLSKLISKNYQVMIDELTPGTYSSRISVSYIFQTGTVPVLLVPDVAVNAPSKMEDCLENNESLACKVATAALEWFDMNHPANGQFQINLQLGGKAKEINFPIN